MSLLAVMAGCGNGTGNEPAGLDPIVCLDSSLDRFTRSRTPTVVNEIVDVAVQGDTVFVCTGLEGLVVIDRSGPALEVVAEAHSRASRDDAGSVCQHVAVRGDRALVTSRGDEFAPTPHATLWDVSNPRRPREVAHRADTALSFEGAAILDTGIFAVGLHRDGIAFLQEESGELRDVATLVGLPNVFSLQAAGPWLYVATGSSLAVIDASAPTSPRLAAELPLEGSPKSVRVAGDVAYVASGAAGVHLVDVGSPNAPRRQATVNTPGSAVDAMGSGTTLYVADWNDSRVYDVTSPSDPRLVAVETIDSRDVIGSETFTRILAVDLDGPRAYLGEWYGLYEYELRQAGAAPDIVVDTRTVLFPPTEVGAESAVTVVVGNEGDAPLEVAEVELEPPGPEASGRIRALGGRLTVPPGGNDFFELRFVPSDDAELRTSLTLSSNDPDECELTLDLLANQRGLSVGDPAPDQDLVDVGTGERFRLEDFRGQVVLLSYFATF